MFRLVMYLHCLTAETSYSPTQSSVESTPLRSDLQKAPSSYRDHVHPVEQNRRWGDPSIYLFCVFNSVSIQQSMYNVQCTMYNVQIYVQCMYNVHMRLCVHFIAETLPQSKSWYSSQSMSNWHQQHSKIVLHVAMSNVTCDNVWCGVWWRLRWHVMTSKVTCDVTFDDVWCVTWNDVNCDVWWHLMWRVMTSNAWWRLRWRVMTSNMTCDDVWCDV